MVPTILYSSLVFVFTTRQKAPLPFVLICTSLITNKVGHLLCVFIFVFILLWMAVHGLNTFFPLKCLCSLFTGRTLTFSVMHVGNIFSWCWFTFEFQNPSFHVWIFKFVQCKSSCPLFFPVSAFGIGLRKSFLVLHHVNGAFIASFKNLKF